MYICIKLFNMKKIFWIFVVSALFTGCSIINVRHITSDTSLTKKSGFFYNLPKTVVTVDIAVDKIYKIKGPYSAYADKFLGLKSVIQTNSTYFEISDIKLNSYSMPDADQYYFVETGKGFKNTIPLQFQLTEAGYMVGVNNLDIEFNEQSTDNTGVNTMADGDDINANFSINYNLIEKIDTIIQKVTLDTAIIEKKTLQKIMVEKTLEQKAKEAADFIMSVKESRYNLLNGQNEVPYSKEAIAFMIEELDKTEQEYLSLFIGKTATQSFHYYYTYCPKNSGLDSAKLLGRFSVSEGVLDSTRFIGKDIVIAFAPSKDTEYVGKFITDNINPKQKKHSFVYRIPEYAEVVVKVNNEEFTKSQFIINQFGYIAEMPYSKGMQLNFYPKSGALKMIKSK